MASATQINNTSYYRLPCGFFLEDFIYEKGLNFNALLYFEAKCRDMNPKVVEEEVFALREEAFNWKLRDESVTQP